MAPYRDPTLRGGKIKRDKIMFDAKGVGRYVPYRQWESEVVNNPTGPTAQRAKKNKDPDLEKITINVIPIRHGEREEVPVEHRGGKVQTITTPYTRIPGGIDPETARRMGFRSAEEGKGSRQKPMKRIKGEEDGEEKTS